MCIGSSNPEENGIIKVNNIVDKVTREYWDRVFFVDVRSFPVTPNQISDLFQLFHWRESQLYDLVHQIVPQSVDKMHQCTYDIDT